MAAARSGDRRLAPHLLTAALAALALAGVACSDDDEGGPAATTAPTTTTAPWATTTTTAAACPPAPAPAAAVDLDGDGVEERWRLVGSGAASDIYELRRVEGCDEVPVTLDGVPAQFAVGGSVLLLQGLRCEGGRVAHLGATSEDGERYATLDLVYELRDGALVRVDDAAGELPASDPALAAYTRFDCANE